MAGMVDRNDPFDSAGDDILDLFPPNYPLCGLSRSEEELRDAYPAILDMPIEQQMEYADAITRRYALNPTFLRTQTPTMDQIDETEVNATSIGNLAFIAHYNGAESDQYRVYQEITTELKRLHASTPMKWCSIM